MHFVSISMFLFFSKNSHLVTSYIVHSYLLSLSQLLMIVNFTSGNLSHLNKKLSLENLELSFFMIVHPINRQILFLTLSSYL